ncbi:uncharacterized protein TM35_000251400 [Trypanosoma theileri]|uniref:Uncharacterized protein n=1 Tax=Trypanosoma theileri TaxID=67003 RepID=A0A1X0NQ65_9TRYP|nr:uncharacterized protein TM35_000251400 [Trypanosoma theileri]ORC86844.1 hypothetical protein TM35_000251400 [Trypanosoma theileri]
MSGIHRRKHVAPLDTVEMALQRRLLGSNGAAVVVRVIRRRSDLHPQTSPLWQQTDTIAPSPKLNRKKSARKQRVICAACRLSKLEWPYCGISGDPHVSEEAIS